MQIIPPCSFASTEDIAHNGFPDYSLLLNKAIIQSLEASHGKEYEETAYFYANQGLILRYLNQWDEAREALQESLRIFKANNVDKNRITELQCILDSVVVHLKEEANNPIKQPNDA